MAATKPQDKRVTVNGVTLRYLDWGTAGKTPLVCLHGHTGQAHIWDEFAEAMCPHYHVLTVDQRGHGKSQWADSGYARDRFVEDLAAFADALGLSRFIIAGLSMGGWNALLYTVDHPERVERIVMVDIGPEANASLIAERMKGPPTPLEFPGLEAAVEWRRHGDPWATEARFRKDTEDQVHQREDGQWTWTADPVLFNVVLPDLTDPKLVSRYWKAMESISCPILEVRGADSHLVTDEVIQRMEKVGKQFRSVDVAAAGHVVPVDNPEEFIAATRSFLGIPG